jgi:hypothetical protein
MPRLNRLEHQFVESFPKPLEPGVLYVSVRFRTAAHLCACGCGQKVVTTLSPATWSLTFDGDTVSLSPSIGSGLLPCRSHYFIRQNRVVWSYVMTDELTAEAQERDAASRERYYRGPTQAPPAARQAIHQGSSTPSPAEPPTPVSPSTATSWWGRLCSWLR